MTVARPAYVPLQVIGEIKALLQSIELSAAERHRRVVASIDPAKSEQAASDHVVDRPNEPGAELEVDPSASPTAVPSRPR